MSMARVRHLFFMGSVAATAAAGFAVAAAAGAFFVSLDALVEFVDAALSELHVVIVQIGPLVGFYRSASGGEDDGAKRNENEDRRFRSLHVSRFFG
jgi:hypothetical protein